MAYSADADNTRKRPDNEPLVGIMTNVIIPTIVCHKIVIGSEIFLSSILS